MSLLAASTTATLLPSMSRADASGRTGLGIVMYCCRIRRDHLLRQNSKFDLYEPGRFLEHCRALGAAGAQIRFGILDASDARALRQQSQDGGLYLEAIVSPPQEKNDVERFDAEMKTAAVAGALAARTTIIPGRRYEYFESLEMFREFERRGRKSLELAAPIAEKHHLPLAVENHKDQRNEERVALFRHISSEYVGACVDTGNSFALLEDPISTVEALAPWAHSVHLKDQALQLYDDGFLLGDIPLGKGGLDLNRMVRILKKAKPGIRFSLELITRDPLKVPCLNEKYWVTFPHLPAKDLARTLRYVRTHSTSEVQYIKKMSPAEQLAREDANVAESLRYAREELGI